MDNAEIHAALVAAAEKYKKASPESFDAILANSMEFVSFIESLVGPIDERYKNKYSIGEFSLSLSTNIVRLSEIGLMICRKSGDESEVQRNALAYNGLFNDYAVSDSVICSDKELDKFIDMRHVFVESLHRAGANMLDLADSFSAAYMIDFIVSVGFSVTGKE